MLLGIRIREIRLQKHLTQQQLSDLVGVSKAMICFYEKGTKKPNMKTFNKIVDGLATTSDYLLGKDNLVKDQHTDIAVYVSKQDLKILSELKKNDKLYKMFYQDPVRTIKLIDLKLNK